MKATIFFPVILLCSTVTTSSILGMDYGKQTAIISNRALTQKEKDDQLISHMRFGSSIDNLIQDIQQGAHVNTTRLNGRTALHFAADCVFATPQQQQKYAQLLLDHNADTEVKNSCRQTPLDHALIRNNIAFAVVLLEHGASCGVSRASKKLWWTADRIREGISKNPPAFVFRYKNELIPTLQQFMQLKDLAEIIKECLYNDLKPTTNFDLTVELNKTRIADLAAARSARLLMPPAASSSLTTLSQKSEEPPTT
jgi:ankyrin repeat protein